MTTTPNLAITHVAASQAQKEVTLNDGLTALDTAICDQLAVDFASGNVTLSSAQYRGYCAFRATNLSVARDLTLPAIKRLTFVNNVDGTAVLSVKRGATTVDVPDGEGRLLYTDGTTDGLFEAGGGSGTGLGGATTYILAGSLAAKPGASQRIFDHLAGSGFALLTGLPGAAAAAKVAATAQTDFDIQVNGVSKGTMRWAAAATVATFIWSADVSIATGDEIEIIAPGSADATLADLTWTLEGAVGSPGATSLSDYWEAELPLDPATAVQDLLAAANTGAAQTALGGTAAGKALFTAADAAAQAAILAPVRDWRGRNVLINGNFDIWQRGTNLASGTGKRYLADRWFVSSLGTTYTASQQAFTLGQTDVPGEPSFFHRVVVTSVAGAGNYCVVQQLIEGVRTLAGQTAMLSFWAKAASGTPGLTFELAQFFGSGGSPSAEVTAIVVSKVTLSTSWQRFTVPVTLPSISGKTIGTNGDDYLNAVFWLDAGSTWNTRTDSLGQQSATFDIARPQLEPGTVATPFDVRPEAIEWVLCRRYYHKSYTPGVAPGTADATGAIFMAAHGASAYMGLGHVSLAMRSGPTITLYNPVTGGTANPIYNYWATASLPASVLSPGATGFSLHVNNTAVGVNEVCGVHYTADAEL